MKFRPSPYLALAPALIVITVMLGASLFYAVLESFGIIRVIGQDALSLDAYRDVLSGTGAAGGEFWVSLGFSLWVSAASTIFSSALALMAAVWLSS